MRRCGIVFPVVLTLGLGLVLYRASDWPRLWLFDLYQGIDPSHHDASQITIIDVDGARSG